MKKKVINAITILLLLIFGVCFTCTLQIASITDAFCKSIVNKDVKFIEKYVSQRIGFTDCDKFVAINNDINSGDLVLFNLFCPQYDYTKPKLKGLSFSSNLFHLSFETEVSASEEKMGHVFYNIKVALRGLSFKIIYIESDI